MRRPASVLALAAGALALLGGSAHAGPFHGVVSPGALPASDFELMADGNAGTLRMTVRWNAIQPDLSLPPAEWNWDGLDAAATDAAANGIRILPVLDAPSPAGAADPPVNRKSRNAFAEFAGALAERYGRGGSFWAANLGPDLPFKTWQIYNEQNGRAHWRAKPSPKDYGKILRAASKAITREDGRAEIVLGGMFATPSGRKPITSWRYLDQLYGMRKVKGAFDTVAVHPYAERLSEIKLQVTKLRDVMRENRDRGAKMRVTEFGWGSARRGHLNEGRKGQAKMLKKAFKLFERNKREWKIKGVNWFSFRDDPAGPCSFCRTAGLLEADGDPKPSWRAFKRVAR